MTVERLSIVLAGLLLASLPLSAQTQQLEPEHPWHPRVPTVTFTFNWPSVEPHRYVISVDSGRDASYESWMAGPGEPALEGEPYMLKFTVSQATRDRIFGIARHVNYFQGDFDFRKHRIADTGQKTLAYGDPDRNHATSYNWSENQGIEQLTSLFEGISLSIEAGRRLARLQRFDRLGLDEELKGLEHSAVEQRATELQIIAPVLEQIAGDSGVMNIARQRARHLLQLAAPPAAPTATATEQ